MSTLIYDFVKFIKIDNFKKEKLLQKILFLMFHLMTALKTNINLRWTKKPYLKVSRVPIEICFIC